jgi:hypothetical protein
LSAAAALDDAVSREDMAAAQEALAPAWAALRAGPLVPPSGAAAIAAVRTAIKAEVCGAGFVPVVWPALPCLSRAARVGPAFYDGSTNYQLQMRVK